MLTELPRNAAEEDWIEGTLTMIDSRNVRVPQQAAGARNKEVLPEHAWAGAMAASGASSTRAPGWQPG